MPPLPEIRDVDRDRVHESVRRILLERDAAGEPLVGNVECIEQPDGRYTLRPHERAGG